MLLLSKLDWDVSSVIASDFIEHILVRLERRGDSDIDLEDLRGHIEAILTLCASESDFIGLEPSLIASSAVLIAVEDEEKEKLLDAIQHFTLIEKVKFYRVHQNFVYSYIQGAS